MKTITSEVPPDVDFEIPSWASKAPPGTHLDVHKGDKLLQKLMIDEKRCYFFGRNPQLCDIAVEHASCSRVHAALLYHKNLKRCFLIDIGSAHGTFISNVRLEAHKPEHLQVDQVFRFGASTRRYILREKPTSAFYLNSQENLGENTANNTNQQLHFLNLPEKEEELDNLTEYNTALNRRIAAMTVPEENFPTFKRRGNAHIVFRDDEEVINPEDIDPNVGKFRNLVQTAVIATKRLKTAKDHFNFGTFSMSQVGAAGGALIAPHTAASSLHGGSVGASHASSFSFGAKLGLAAALNIAPEVELYSSTLPEPSNGDTTGAVSAAPKRSAPIEGVSEPMHDFEDESVGPRKKKYAKEAWPGKKPGHALLV